MNTYTVDHNFDPDITSTSRPGPTYGTIIPSGSTADGAATLAVAIGSTVSQKAKAIATPEAKKGKRGSPEPSLPVLNLR
jgi:hypothetical protein